jgi:hypothetical protein
VDIPGKEQAIHTHSNRQDLVAAACTGCQRRFSHLTFPGISINQDVANNSTAELSPSFIVHRDVLGDDLMGCIRDIITFQATYDTGDCNFTSLDKWQASIESRLVFLTSPCHQFGVISECCRLAAYICCYSIYTEIWKSSSIPLKQAEMLIKRLSESQSYSIWGTRRDLFLWLVLVCTSIIQGSETSSQSVRQQQENFIGHLCNIIVDWDVDDKCLKRALESFIYVGDWVQCRCSNR